MAMSTALIPDKAFKEFTRHVGTTLRAHGFQGSGQNFRRAIGDQWQAINLQKTQWRVKEDPVDFYVNIGFYFPELKYKRYLPGPKELKNFREIHGDERLRVENLISDDNLKSFICVSSSRSAFEGFVRDFTALVNDRIVPALNEASTKEGLARLIRTCPAEFYMKGGRLYVGPKLAPPRWDHEDFQAGLWTKDREGLWWGPGEVRGSVAPSKSSQGTRDRSPSSQNR
jgi:hypothetical protein